MGDPNLTSKYSFYSSRQVPNPEALGYVLGKTLGTGTFAQVVEAKLINGGEKVSNIRSPNQLGYNKANFNF